MVVTPEDGEQEAIGRIIETELEYGIVKTESRSRMEQIALRVIREEDADAVVLGCTELPLIFEQTELPVETLDVMRIHIDALIKEILET